MTTILLDLGGVLLNVNFDVAIDTLAYESNIERQQIFYNIFVTGLKEKHDAGDITSVEFYQALFPDRNITFGMFRDIWCDIFTENEEVIDYVLTIAKTSHICLASNTDPLHFKWFREKYNWLSNIDLSGVSFQLGVTKPSSDFFVKLCSLLQVEYSNTVFIDDLPENIQAAQRLSITSHRFTNISLLMQFLKTYGG